MVALCCICKVESGLIENVSFHKIPKDEAMKAKWVANIGKKVKAHNSVCSRHFEAKDFVYKIYGKDIRRFLVSTAVPSSSFTKTYDKYALTDANENNENKEFILSDNELNSNQNANKSDSESTSEMENDDKFIRDSSMTVKDNSLPVNYSVDPLDNSQSTVGTSQKPNLKRQPDIMPLAGAKRFSNARYIGDLRREDFTSNTSWNIVQKHLTNSRKKEKHLHQKIRKLNQKVKTLQSLLNHLKEKFMPISEIRDALQTNL